jgi:hypothetical protein
MPKRKPHRDIALPWERRGNWVRELLAGHRFKMVLVAAGVLGLGVVTWQAAERRERVRDTRVAIGEVKRAITSFRSEVGRCPKSPEELIRPPEPAHRSLREIPRDGWGRELYIQCPARHDPLSAEVLSAGPSGSFLSDDNVR